MKISLKFPIGYIIAFMVLFTVLWSRTGTELHERYTKSVHKIVLIQPYEAPVLKFDFGELHMEKKFPFRAKYRGGSGVLVRKDGVILTAAHVVRGTSIARIQLHDGRVYKAVVIAKDVDLDLALLKVVLRPDRGFKVAKIGKERPIGYRVYAIGNPLGMLGVLTDGIISCHNKDIEIVTNTVINPGSSGGGLFDGNTDELLGVTVGLRTPTPYNAFAGHSIAVRTSTVKEFLKRNLPLCSY